MEPQTKTSAILRSVLTGTGVTVLFLLIGTVLDYIVTQVLSQFFIANCSEDCSFRYFNLIFLIVAFLSVVGGILSGIRTYKRLYSEYPDAE
jgi:galactitol-specific phosphotransferase system IIC component